MGISTFPAPDTGGVTNDFILNKANTTNNVFEPGRSFAAGGYAVVVTGSTAYDLYLLDSTGSSVGYTNGTSIVATDSFETIVGLGLGTADVISFTYNGPSTNASAIGNETGAGAYLTSIIPSDLPNPDDTAIVVGGNFASNVQITFTSGTVELAAKNIVYSSSTALVVTRPDALYEDDAPYDLVAVNPGVTAPSGSNANVLAGTVTAGTDPSFITTSPILGAQPNVAFSSAILASDSEGSVISWAVTAGTLPSGITLGSADGALVGTPTAGGDYTFTVQIADNAGNTNSAEFNMPVGILVSGGNSTAVGGYTYHWFTTSGDLSINNAGTAEVEYLVIAGGGGGGRATSTNYAGAGGGAGGLVYATATYPAGTTVAITIGAGGAVDASGTNTVYGTAGGGTTAYGGGYGGNGPNGSGGSGGSGGGAVYSSGVPGAGTAGQGFAGGNGGLSSSTGGGDGRDFGAWATAINIIYDGGYFGGGGEGGQANIGGVVTGGGGGGASEAGNTDGSGEGLGGGGRGSNGFHGSSAGSANSGGGGGGAKNINDVQYGASAGGSGLVVVRYSS